MLDVGMAAPQFALPDQNGTIINLSDHAGKKVILYFYSKDSTSGCTKQACAFAARQADFTAKNAVVIGVSKDSSDSHLKFAEKYGLPFVLLSDTDHAVLEAYGVWQEKKSSGKVTMGTVRTTYLIDENGVIEKVWKKVKPEENAGEILAYLQ